ncbi:MAG: NAD(+)/NADH kinase [Myxococcota bacterium]
MPIIADEMNARALHLLYVLQMHRVEASLPANLYVVIGGDGFMLRCVRNYHAPERIFLGLNCGRMGFLLNEVPEEQAWLPELLRVPPKVFTFPRIRMLARNHRGEQMEALALNDIYLERMTGQACHLRLEIDGTQVVQEVVCDGMIFSTALGSTAYSYSAGGTPCHPLLDIVAITSICPHVPKLPQLFFPLSSKLHASVLSVERRRVRAVVDGVDFDDVVDVTVTNAQSPVKLAFFEQHDFTAALVQKVLHF